MAPVILPPLFDDEYRRHPSIRPPPPETHGAPAPADAYRVGPAHPVARGRRLRRALPARPDDLPELHEPGVPRRPRADEVGRPPELPRPLARPDLPRLRRHNGE